MISSVQIHNEKDFLNHIIHQDYYSFLKNELNKYTQHGHTTIFKHSRDVAFTSYRVGCYFKNKFHTQIDFDSLIKAGYMHDLFMYDWHEPSTTHRLHGYTHPKVAVENAIKYCNADSSITSIIYSHMWPLTITKIPKSKEAWILTLCDKFVTLAEVFQH